MAEEKKDAAAAEAKPKKNMGMILQLLFAVLNLGVIGAGGYLVYSSTLGWHAPQITEAHAMEEKDKNSEAAALVILPSLITVTKVVI